MPESEKKVYILDTNILIYNPTVIDDLGDNVIVVPLWVVEELDDIKRLKPQLAFTVREATRNIEKYRAKAESQGRFLRNGVETDGGGIVFVDYNAADISKLGLGYQLNEKVDNRVILTAKHWKDQEDKKPDQAGKEVILLSQDVNMRIKASAISIKSEDWQRDKLVSSVDQIFSGIIHLELSAEKASDVNNKLHRDDGVLLSELSEELGQLEVNPNTGFVFHWTVKDTPKTSLGIYRTSTGKVHFVKGPHAKTGNWKRRIKPVNNEQALALALLMESTATMVTLLGPAGTGKTLMALLAGKRLVESADNEFDKILVWRPITVVGEKELGYYPGTLEEKFEPWARPIIDAYSLLVTDRDIQNGSAVIDYVRAQITQHILSVEPLIHVRGKTVNNTILILDEVQNMTPHEITTAVTRLGHDSKIILTGDIGQIDSEYLSALSNGLTFTVERWKDSQIAAHISFVKPERSAFVEEAIRRMR